MQKDPRKPERPQRQGRTGYETNSRIAKRKRELAKRRLRRRRAALLVLLLLIVAASTAWLLYAKSAGKPKSAAANVTEMKNIASSELSSKTPPPEQRNAEATLTSESGVEQGLVIIGLGDLLFDRQVAKAIKEKGVEDFFAGVEGSLASGDIVIGNLESPLSLRGKPEAGKEHTFRGLPEAAGGMRNAGINMVSLANNHIMDYGPDALSDTLDLLGQAGIAYAGAGINSAEAQKHSTFEVKGSRVAFFAYSAVVPEGSWATSKRPGTATTRENWSTRQSAIEAASKEHDFVIVSFHWGLEYEDHPQEYQRDYARRVIDAGADMVIGHHPHVIQGIELYKGKIIAYSLGDFVFDHYSRKTGETYILKAEFAGGAPSKVSIIPAYADYSGKPAIVRGDEAQAILGRLKKISEPFKTEIIITGDTAEIVLPQ
jgi:poly-gamma-glutamate synthesis protein (capsule biosynthesis protein)